LISLTATGNNGVYGRTRIHPDNTNFALSSRAHFS
jgi:hypothetical protein